MAAQRREIPKRARQACASDSPYRRRPSPEAEGLQSELHPQHGKSPREPSPPWTASPPRSRSKTFQIPAPCMRSISRLVGWTFVVRHTLSPTRACFASRTTPTTSQFCETRRPQQHARLAGTRPRNRPGHCRSAPQSPCTRRATSRLRGPVTHYSSNCHTAVTRLR
jgi:hypothetical protein